MAEHPTNPLLRSGKAPAIKGLIFKKFVKWYEDTNGRERTVAAYQSLPEALRLQLDPAREQFGILAGTWYSVHIISGMLEAITLGLAPEARSKLLRDGVQHAVSETLTGVYKVLFQTLITPERHAKYAQKIWNQYYNTGTVVAAMLDAQRSEQIVTDWDGHHPLLCELSLSSLTAFHEHMGCKNVRVRRTSCVLDARLAARHLRRPPSSTKMRAVRPAEPTDLAAPVPMPEAPSSEPRIEACRFLIQWDER